MSAPSGSWLPDPTGRHELRWHDGTTYTDQVADGGATSVDPFEAAAPFSAPVPPIPQIPTSSEVGMPSAPPVLGATVPPPGSPAPAPVEATGGRSKLPVVVAAVVALALAAAAFVLLGGDDELSDDELEELADEVLDDLDLPGDEIDDVGIDAFSIDCLVEEADLDGDAVVEDVGPVAATGGLGADDDPEDFFQLGVALHVLADADAGAALLEAAAVDDVTACLAQANGFDDDFEPDLDVSELDVDGQEALVVVERETEFARSYLLVGRVLVNAQGFASDEDRREELLTDVLSQARAGLREGGA